ncbi:aryl-sulfate sulfotransferase [Hymenobacter psychrophilus]|uniref:Por secretion system C-terminal sorting domain-containing protein n=1 Tax=Hymenobacter psychrophilus TaxID=651662 RepID=A0A1H3LCB7_9BACT|nr:aryl-sulfate sulfotransferase [Hymenobacter psychrophilus]SDY61515.1 Por secretion system C-terminal sorting domain-containing protein [Hymenobacter psychrophilus]
MKKTRYLLLLLAALSGGLPPQAQAQQTVGVQLHAAGSTDDGYVLLAPIQYTRTYLMDKCGREVHGWNSAYKAGQAAYLLPDGTLLRAGAPANATFTAGGLGGIIEKIDWNGTVTWSYQISNTAECQHHDIRILPNGNILALVWETKTAAQVTAAGRNASQIGASNWSEKVVELQPVGTNQATVVWEWHAWDHLVQDQDPAKANYAPVAQHPELLNVNYGATANNPDWLHLNALDYNPDLDQILLSSHGLDEVWVLDHGTTTAQAAGHAGGTRGHGGDLLYRWGNPAAYGQGSAATQQLFGQHNAYWLPAGVPYAGSIQVFNNGQGRPAGKYSSVDVLTPPQTAPGVYAAGLPYGPNVLTTTYADPTPTSFYAQNISGAQRLPNGNLLVCNGPAGRVFEVTSTGAKVWDYINPVSATGPVAQGTTARQNVLFRAPFYPASYAAFSGRTLPPGAPLELNLTASSCSLVLGTATAAEAAGLTLYPNPAASRLTIEAPWPAYEVQVRNLTGQLLQQGPNLRQLLVAGWPAGIYVLSVQAPDGTVLRRKFSVDKP